MSTRIQDIKVILTAPEGINLLVVKVETIQPGLYGLGCATFAYRHLSVKSLIEDYLKPLLMGRDAHDVSEAEACSYIAGYGIGLDLTARDTQSELKAKGMPWTKAKAFATAACVSAFAPASAVANPQALTFSLTVNGERRQQGDTALMLFPLAQLISFLSQHYGLTAGDLSYTGTPEGVARLQSGDALALSLDGLAQAQFTVA